MLPITPHAAPPMNTHRRPKISETLPIIVRLTATVRVYERATQTTLGSYPLSAKYPNSGKYDDYTGPISALMVPRIGAA
jgi:hypothetical protein